VGERRHRPQPAPAHRVKQPKVPKRGWMVYVEMDDIEHSPQGWTGANAIRAQRPEKFKAIGWVVRGTKRTLTIASVTSPGAAFCHYLIPMRSIRRIDRLK